MKLLRTLIVVSIVFAGFQTVAAQNICTRVSQIKVLPFKGESGLDANYDAFMSAGKSALPCLIRNVTDTRRIHDPRTEPGYPGIQVRVGDVAYFLLADIAKTDFVFLLPLPVQKQWKESGVWAYFNFVQRKSNREWFQRRLKAWYRTHASMGANEPSAGAKVIEPCIGRRVITTRAANKALQLTAR